MKQITALCLLILLLLISNLVAQTGLLPISTGEKHNERGYQNSISKSRNGNEIISDYDGNFSLVYGQNMNLPNEMGGELTVNYNSNVEHRVFLQQFTSVPTELEGYSVNAPEWIIGFNGFALQTLNFEVNFYSHKVNTPGGQVNLVGEETSLLIPGYHYSNKLWYWDPQYPHSFQQYDYIQFLMSDGSKKTIYNEVSGSFSGKYHETGPDQVGYAIVEIYDNDEMLRDIWFKPGDGLTYYFREESINFNDGRIGGYWSNEYKPKTIYLKSINNFYGDTLLVDYNPNMLSRPDLVYGRKLFSSIAVSSYSTFFPSAIDFSGIAGTQLLQLFVLDYITLGVINTQPNTALRAIDIYNNWDKAKMRYTIPFDGVGSNWFSPYRKNSSQNYSKINMINSIIDESGRIDRIHYFKDTRNYRYDPVALPLFQYSVPASLIDSIFYYNGRVTYLTYENETNDVYTYNLGSGYIDPNFFLSASKRDRRTNFMVKKKEMYKNNGGTLSLIEKETYNYGAQDQNYYSHQFPYSNIWTEIIKEKPFGDTDNSSPDLIKVRKYFDKIYIGARRSALHDITTTIKLKKEVVDNFDNEQNSTEFFYHLGNCITNQTDWPYYDGTLWLDSISVISAQNQVSSRKTSKFDYSYSSYFSPNHQQPRYIMNSKTETDPIGLKKLTQFQNYIPSDRLDKTKYFSLGKTAMQKMYNSQQTLSCNNYEYHILGPSIGRLRRIVNNSHLIESRQDKTEYFYKSQGEPQTIGVMQIQMPNVYKGFLDSTVQNSEVKTKFIYHIDKNVETTMYDPGGYMNIYENGVIIGSIYMPPRYKYRYSFPVVAKALRTDGSVIDSTFEPYVPLYSKAPVKTRIFYNSDQDTIEFIQLSDEKNNLVFEVNSNGFASEFEYDIVGNLIRVKLPGSYPAEGTSQISQSLVRYNNDFTFTRNLSINSVGIITGNCNTNAKIISNGNVEPHETDDPIGGDSEEAPGEAVEGPGGSGGGTTTPLPNEYYHIFLPEMLKTNNINTINFATLFLQCRHLNISENQERTFKLYAITQAYTNGMTQYQSVGPLTVVFQEDEIIEIDVSSLLLTLKNANKNLYGFKLIAEGLFTSNEDYKHFFFSQTTFPTMSVSLNIWEEYSGNASYEYVYDDTNNKVDITKKMNFSALSPLTAFMTDHYDVRGNLIKSQIKNDADIFETKSTLTYNYLGLNSKVTDAEDRNLFNKYDYFSRPKETRLVTDTEGAPKIRYDYSPIDHTNEYEKQTIFDESNNKTEKILDKSGKILREIRYDDEVPFTTTYNYNQLQQLTTVTTPGNKTINYYYDDLGNVSKKVDPNSGTVQFKYDRFKQLRFELQASSPSTEDSIIFNKYDNMSRISVRGMKDDAEMYAFLNPDQTYPFENDTSKYLVVNMYDKYFKSGVFNNMSDPYVASMLINNGNHKGRLVATAFRNRLGDQWSFKVYGYDALGRVDDFWIKYENQNWKWIRNSYDHAGNLIKQTIEGDMYYWYDYDSQGRLNEVRTSIHNNKSTAKLEAVYAYNKDNKISQLIFSDLRKTQDRVTYSYDSRGRLTGISDLYTYINGPNVIDDHPRFTEGLTYYPNGNIEFQTISNKGLENTAPNDLHFNYFYDGLNRLTTTKNYGSNYEWYTYDPDGNFITKTRPGKHMIYTPFPGTDRLQKVDIGGVDKFYQYDNRGNVISDGLRQITSISYDRRNLPLSMTTTIGANFKYKYDDNGNRLLKHANGVKEFYLRDHTGKELAVYNLYTSRIKMANIYGNGLIGKANVRWDSVWTYVYPDSDFVYSRTDERHYYIKDHLGSIRIVLDKNGEVVSAQDYYPFGEIISSRSYVTGASTNDKYKFTEKERDTETNYDYFGARYYDSELGRWLQVDPLADKYPGWSPYNYTLNNPLRYIDPNGAQVAHPDPIWSYGFATGFIDGVKNSVEGLYNAVTNPKETVENLYHAITNPGETLEAIGNNIDNWGERVTSPNPLESSSALGEGAAIVSEALIGAKGLSKLKSVENIVSKVDEVTEVVTKSEKIRKTLGRDGGISKHIFEESKGKTISVTHSVTKGGKTVHQHQTHYGKYGSSRRFPENWIENKTIED